MKNNALIMKMFAGAGRFRPAENPEAGQDGAGRSWKGLGTCGIPNRWVPTETPAYLKFVLIL